MEKIIASKSRFEMKQACGVNFTSEKDFEMKTVPNYGPQCAIAVTKFWNVVFPEDVYPETEASRFLASIFHAYLRANDEMDKM